jgi:transcription antitermination factor NusG
MYAENDYEKTPVNGFGEKILSKTGWFKGRGIGKYSQGEVPLHLKLKPRGERHGLGSEKQKLIEKKCEIEIGSTAEVISGKHAGITGVIIEVLDQHAILQIKNNKNNLKIPIINLILGKIQKTQVEPKKSKELRWVVPGLKVKIRNKFINDGAFYNCKALIEDVLDDKIFTVRISNEIIDYLNEKDLQTILPSVGSQVRIVKGKHKGEISKLLSRDKVKNLATVQLLDEIVQLKQDYICDYIRE